MSQPKDKNKKLPDQAEPGVYPLVYFEQYRDGGWHRQDSTFGNETYAWGHRLGSYREIEQTGALKEFTANTKHDYVQAGSTTTSEFNHHSKIGGSTIHQTDQDAHREVGGDRFHAGGAHEVRATHGAVVEHANETQYRSSYQDHVLDHSGGHNHQNINGDEVRTIAGTHYERVGGEKGVYLPSGNYDIQLDSGNLRIAVGQSIILMTPDSITLTSPHITLTSNDIKLGGPGANKPLAMLDTVDTCGCADIDNLSSTTKTF